MTKIGKQKCPICGKEFQDILEHLVIIHGVKNMEQLKQLKEQFDKRDEKSKQFSTFVTQLNLQLKEGKITAKEFRELRDNWWKTH